MFEYYLHCASSQCFFWGLPGCPGSIGLLLPAATSVFDRKHILQHPLSVEFFHMVLIQHTDVK